MGGTACSARACYAEGLGWNGKQVSRSEFDHRKAKEDWIPLVPEILGNTFRSLRIPNYRIYFFTQIVSFSGTWAQLVAESWLVLRLTGSGVALGTVMALQFGPTLLAGAWGGLVADRFDKRRIVIGSQAAMALLALTLGALTATDVITVWMVYALALLVGIVMVIDKPAREAFTIEMVGTDSLANAVALDTSVFTVARMVGPALAGGLIALTGLAACFFINATSYLAVLVGLIKMNDDALRRRPPLPKGKGQLREGIRQVARNGELHVPLVLLAVSGLLAFNLQVILPLMAKRVFEEGAGTYGLLFSAVGVGTALGSLLAANLVRPDHRLTSLWALGYGVCVFVCAVVPGLGAAMVAFAVAGFAHMVFVALTKSTMQVHSEDAMRGRVMSLRAVVFLGSTALGSPLIGWLAQDLGPRFTLGMGGVATAVAALVILVLPRRWGSAGRDLVNEPRAA